MGSALISKVIVSTDFSEASTSAYPYAIEAARAHTAALQLVHVFDEPMVAFIDPHAIPPPEVYDSIRRERITGIRELLTKTISDHFGSVPCTPLVIEQHYSAADALIAYAGRNSETLLIVASHGHGTLGRLVLGSVAERVLRRAECCVMLIPPKSKPQQHLPFRKIITTTDFSESSASAAAFARAIAAQTNASISLVHVIDHTYAPELFTGKLSIALDHADAIQKHYREELATHLAKWAEQHFDVDVTQILLDKTSSVPASLLDYCKKEQADLIVMSKKGRGGVLAGYIGGVVERVGRHAECPTLVVPEATVR